MQTYRFLTEWFFNSVIEDVWQELEDFQSFPEWWTDWKKLELRGKDSKVKVGSIFDCVVKGSLPYSFHYTLEITEADPPYFSAHRASGGLVGSGKWILSQQGEGTKVEHHWNVSTANPVLNTIAKVPLIKKLMQKNHDDMMDRGYKSLKTRLEIKAKIT